MSQHEERKHFIENKVIVVNFIIFSSDQSYLHRCEAAYKVYDRSYENLNCFIEVVFLKTMVVSNSETFEIATVCYKTIWYNLHRNSC